MRDQETPLTNEEQQYIAMFGREALAERDKNELSIKPVSRLRDEFAMHALSGLLANANVISSHSNHGWGLVNCDDDQLLSECYSKADAAIKARSKS